MISLEELGILHPAYFDTIRQIKYWIKHFTLSAVR